MLEVVRHESEELGRWEFATARAGCPLRGLVWSYTDYVERTTPLDRRELPVADGDIAYLREKQKELNAMLAAQAAANGASLIDWYRASIGHDACKPPLIRWVEPLVPANAAAPVHPNLLGMIGAAKLVVEAAR